MGAPIQYMYTYIGVPLYIGIPLHIGVTLYRVTPIYRRTSIYRVPLYKGVLRLIIRLR